MIPEGDLLNKIRKASVVGLLAVVAATVAQGAAVADPIVPSMNVNDYLKVSLAQGSSGGDQVAAVCGVVLGVSQQLNTVTYEVHGTADGTSATGAVALGTNVICRLYYLDSLNKPHRIGQVAGGLPGPHAEAVGSIDVPTNRNAVLCAIGNAVFNDGETAVGTTCPTGS